jgi:hypothetical protein
VNLPPRRSRAKRHGLVLGVVLWATASAALAAGPGAVADSSGADSLAFAPPGDSLGTATPVLPALDDTLGLRLEAGPGVDVTNEQFYEDLFDSSIVARRIGRQLVSMPETRSALLVDGTLAGTRDARRARHETHLSVSLGDRLQRGALDAAWRQSLGPWTQLSLLPRFEVRHDRTFGRDLDETRAGILARVRRTLPDDATVLELAGGGDLLRASGQGAEFLLDRNSGTVSGAIGRDAWGGDEWRGGYTFNVRTFPDSVERNHLEHAWEGRWRHGLSPRWALVLDSDGARRSTIERAPTSRDNFWQGRVALELSHEPLGGWGARMRGEGELLHYDIEDTTVFENERTARAEALLRWSAPAGQWTIGVGPRGEVFSIRRDPGEDYREIAGTAELEWLTGHVWWNVTPVAGWRAYRDVRGPDDLPALHSSFAFLELGVFGDQFVAPRTKLRLFGNVRAERHTDASQDARSLYFSCELRRLF